MKEPKIDLIPFPIQCYHCGTTIEQIGIDLPTGWSWDWDTWVGGAPVHQCPNCKPIE